MFVNPKNFDYHVTTQDAKKWAPLIIEEIKK
jgi:adenylylsulfate kinase